MDSPRDVIPYRAGRLNGEVRFYDRLDSTNSTLKTLADGGAAEGLVIAADEQLAGRGRLGRSWRSPAGAGLYMSLLVRPRLAAMDVALLSLAGGLAVADTLAGLGVGAVELKWPNDVLVAGRKISGVLAEASFRDGDPEWVVLGIGVNLKVEAVPLDLTDRATSLDQEAVPIDAKSLMVQLLTALGLWYGRLEVQGPASVVDAWVARAPMAKGRVVSVANGDDRYEATTDGVTPHGALRVRLTDGQTRELSSGEVTLSAVADGK